MTGTTAQSTPEPDDAQPEDAAAESEPDDTTEPDKTSRRDARYREQLRTTESERNGLRAGLLPYVRAAVELKAAAWLADPKSLWLLHDLDVMSLVGDDYTVDDEKVGAAVDRLLDHAPSLATRTPSFDGGARATASEGASWSRLIKGE